MIKKEWQWMSDYQCKPIKIKMNKIETRGTAEIWKTHSAYYPFYRNMVDDTKMNAPAIGGGSLPSNPLSIKMKGSEKELNVPPLEAIARNSLSILTAAMKNDGTMKLIRDLEKLNNPERGIKEATLITDKKQLGGINSVFVFENA